MMNDTLKLWSAMALTAALAVGCAESETPETDTAAAAAPDAVYLLATEPADALGVGDVRESSEDDESVTVIGRIGGSREPFVEGVAAFTIVDPAIPHCAAEEGCPTPWDYCCAQDKVKDNITLVKIVDDQGRPVTKDAKALLGVKELSTVVVQGKAQRDEAGNLTVLADKVFVKK
ncbi:MAG: hypothetical protein ACREJB_16050 [Planctomycetaceae bacterium]